MTKVLREAVREWLLITTILLIVLVGGSVLVYEFFFAETRDATVIMPVVTLIGAVFTFLSKSDDGGPPETS